MRTRVVVMVLFNGVQSLDVTGPLEVFAGANRWLAGHGGGAVYEVRTASLGGGPVRTSSGLLITPDGDLRDKGPRGTGLLDTGLLDTDARDTGPRDADSRRDDLRDVGTRCARGVDMLVVPGGEGARAADPALVAWLREHGPPARQLVSVCTGAFLLAEAGLLARRRVTTHWAYCDQLARSFPELRVCPEPIFVRDGNVATSAGVTAGIDLALALVEDELGRDAALEIARHLVVFLRRPGNQAQFSAQLAAQVAQREPLRDVQQWIAERPGLDLTVEVLAERASLSPRQFARAFAAEVGMPPGRYVGKIRIEAARRRLEDTGEGIEQTARACGFGTPEAMRRAFIRALGVSPAEYRRRFRPGTGPPGDPPTRPRGDLSTGPLTDMRAGRLDEENHGDRDLAV